jgi:hypothetical protein
MFLKKKRVITSVQALHVIFLRKKMRKLFNKISRKVKKNWQGRKKL